MASSAYKSLGPRLKNVEELLHAHSHLTGGGVGAPSKKAGHRTGSSLVRAGYVLLTCALEAFVEDLYEEAGKLVYANLPHKEREALYKQTSQRFNTPTPHNINMLYYSLGMPNICADIKWQKRSNKAFRDWLERLVKLRGEIAHGKMPRVRKDRLKSCKKAVERFAKSFESKVAGEVKRLTGTRPSW